MSVSDLGRLLESGEYKRCLERAEALLEDGEHDAEGAARIHSVILRSCLELTDYFAAAKAGSEAVRLAERAGAPDLVGFALVDLATAEVAIRQYDQALAHIERYMDEMPHYTGARCQEGTALRRLGDVLLHTGRRPEALDRYWDAHRWFIRFGDEPAARECLRVIIRVHLDQGETAQAAPLLAANDEYALSHEEDRLFLTNHLMDRALFHLVKGEHAAAAQVGFQALQLAENRLDQQASAQLLLAQSALAQERPREALSFALAARVAAIDGRLYDTEFAASEILFRLLRTDGPELLKAVAGDFYAQGVDIYHYLSEQVIKELH